MLHNLNAHELRIQRYKKLKSGFERFQKYLFNNLELVFAVKQGKLKRKNAKKPHKNPKSHRLPPKPNHPPNPPKNNNKKKHNSCPTTKSQRDHHKSYLLITAVRQNFKEYYIKLLVSIMRLCSLGKESTIKYFGSTPCS